MQNNKINTLDINNLYTNLPTKGIREATKYWLRLSTINKAEQEQLVSALRIIKQQNYFQYNNQYYQPSKGVALGSPLSGNLAELFLQYLKKSYIKHWINTKELCFYTRYVDDIIYDANRTTEKNIVQWFNGIDTKLKFKLTVENNSCISFLDLNIQRKPDKIELGVYRKETNTDKTIHNNSNLPQEHKIASYRFYINRLTTLPITKKEKIKNGT